MASRCFSPNESFGCDFQGFYSLVGSIAGMLSGLMIAAYTYMIACGETVLGQDAIRSRLPSKKTTSLVSLAIFGLALLIGMLVIVAFGHYRNNNEGFCYINWYKGAQSGIMFVITLPTFVAGIYLFVRVLMSGNWPNKVRCVPALDPGTSSGLSRP